MIDVEVDGEPRRLYLRERGDAQGQRAPLLFLHGGWGYEIYPFDHAAEVLGNDRRVIVPDRSGYGRSNPRARFERGFHRDAAREMLALLDALQIDDAALWGHSDGAISAALMALEQPERFPWVILEAIHHDRAKPASRGFFEDMVERPERFGRRVAQVLAQDHGDDWRRILAMEGEAWLDILDTADDPTLDLFGGALSSLAPPCLILHGADDPRTEPGELDAVRASLPDAAFAVLDGAGHSPHSEPDHRDAARKAATDFVQRIELER